MRCGEKRFIVRLSDEDERIVSARTPQEARRKAKDMCGSTITIESVQRERKRR